MSAGRVEGGGAPLAWWGRGEGGGARRACVVGVGVRAWGREESGRDC